MAKIQGLYLLSAPIYVSGDNTNKVIYTYTNNDRGASIGFSNECKLDFSQLDPQAVVGVGGANREFLCNAKVTIKRARIFTPGSHGVQGAEDSLAARLVLQPWAWDGVIETDASRALELRFENYNEWHDFETVIEAYELKKRSNSFNLRIKANAPAFLTVDDYNLQSAYEGQNLYARLDMLVDTAGMWDPNLGAIV